MLSPVALLFLESIYNDHHIPLLLKDLMDLAVYLMYTSAKAKQFTKLLPIWVKQRLDAFMHIQVEN